MNKTKSRPFIIGITGTIGSGKSTVGEIINKEAIPVIDTDHIVHNLFNSDTAIISAIRDRFGPEVIIHNGGAQEIDRIKLGKIIFNDKDAKKDLEAIVHPATILACRRIIAQHSESPIVAVLVPLLFEARLESEYDQIWTVYTDLDVLTNRLSERDDLDQNEIEKRLSAQLSQEEKIKRANHVINNSGTKDETKAQIITLLDKIRNVSKNGN